MTKKSDKNPEAKISRKEFTKRVASGLSGAVLSSFLPTGTSANEMRAKINCPNIVFICIEQHCFKHTGYAGHNFVSTPNLDRIAGQGVNFQNAYCGSPVCTPGRACLMTGMFPSDSNSFGNTTVWDGSHPTWGTRLLQAGYETWATGKLDLNPKFDIGFDQVATSNGHAHNPDITELFRRPVGYRMGERPDVTGQPREHRHRHDTTARDKALKHLRSTQGTDKPWATYIGFTLAHSPFVALDKYYQWYYPGRVDMPNIPPGHLEELHLMFQELRRFKSIATPIPDERIRRARAGYFVLISELDEYIGQLWDELEKKDSLTIRYLFILLITGKC